MGTNNAGAAAGLNTTARRSGTTSKPPAAALGPQPPDERYAQARRNGTDVAGWRSLASAYDWSADNADTIALREQRRERADDCRRRAEQMRTKGRRATARQAVAA